MSASAEVELMLERNTDPAERKALESIRGSLARIRDVLKRVGELNEARTRQYVGDVGMIDISATPVPAPRVISRGEAVIWVADEDLVRVISLLLRHAGFTVREVGGRDELRQETGKLGVSLVVIGVPEAGGQIWGGFQPSRDRFYTLVALVNGSGGAERKAGADHTVTLPFDPGSFTEEVLRAMKNE